MERKYIALVALLVILASGLVILPSREERKEVAPHALLNAIAEHSRYLDADQVTKRIIGNDPALLLIDLRKEDQYKLFTLPGAVRVDPDSLLTTSVQELFTQPGKDKVLFANADLLPEQIWLICARYAIPRVYVLKGGLNGWYNTIIRERVASATASSADLDLISFRNAARQYFTNSTQVTPVTTAVPAAEKVQVTRKAPAAAAGGGC